MECDNLNAEDVPPRGQVGGDLDAVLLEEVQRELPPIRSATKACLSSVFQQLVDGPAAGVALVKDLDPNVTLTVGACRCEVRNFGHIRDVSDVCR